MYTLYDNEKGTALVIGLMFLVMLTLLGIAAVTITSTDMLISGSYKSTTQALHSAEAGTEEARARLRANATNPIADANPTQAPWRAYIGTASATQAKGYDASNGLHFRFDRLQNNLNYTVEIKHQTDGGGNILYWGDPDGNGLNARTTVAGLHSENIYVLTSYFATSAHKTVQIEAARVPAVTIPGTLYVEAQTTIMGSSTNIIGDTGVAGCGTMPGIATTLDNTQVGSPPRDSVDQSGHPNIVGNPPIQYLSTNLDVQGMVNTLKESADHTYTVTSATQTGTTTPGPGDGWGQPTLGASLQDPSSCSEHHIVHYNTGGTYLKFNGGVTGCGILLIEGDLDIHGGFSWYGAILVTGSLVFSGGGNKNITGAVLSGGSALADTVGGNANIVYCSDAITTQTQNQPLLVLSWKDL